MTTFNTGNAVPSGDARDRFDNTQTLDEVVTGPADTALTRLGTSVQTLKGMNNTFNQFLINSGFEPTHLIYVDGQTLQVDRPTQLIDRSGITYRVEMPANFPVTLSGTWASDLPLLVDVGDSSLRQELAAPTGAGKIGIDLDLTYVPGTVGAVLAELSARVKAVFGFSLKSYGMKGDGVTDDSANFELLAQAVNAVPNTGRPVQIDCEDGVYLLSQPVAFTRPVILFSGGGAEFHYTGTGKFITMGPPGATAPNFYMEDHYIVDGIMFTGGKNMTHGVFFNPYSALMGQVKNTICYNFGNPTSWAFYFDVNNWWPIIFNNRWETYDNQAFNWVSIPGKNATSSDGGNSRVIWSNNSGKWQGGDQGGVGVYINAVKSMILNSSFEHAYAAIQFGPLSTFSTVQNIYFEQALGGSCLRFGQESAPVGETIYGIDLSNIFVNLHNTDEYDSDAVFALTSGPNVKVQDITIDNLKVVNGGKFPLINLNQTLPDQSGFKFGNISALNCAVINNHVGMLRAGALNYVEGIPATDNGDFSHSSVTYPVSIPAGGNSAVADNWTYQHDFSGGASVSRNLLSATDIAATRGSYYEIAAASSGSGTFGRATLVLPNLRKFCGEWVTLQFYAKSSPSMVIGATVVAVWAPGVTSAAYTTFVSAPIVGGYQEVTASFFVPNASASASFSKDSILAIQVTHSTAGYLAITGVRINKAQSGLCFGMD